MKSVPLWVIVTSLSAFGLPAATAAPASGPTEFKSIEEILDLIPKEMANDLDSKSKKDAAARDISSHLQQATMGKPATLELHLDSWRPWADFPGAAYQLRPAQKEFRASGVRYLLDMWVYVVPASGPALEKLKHGYKFKATGTFARAEVSCADTVRLHLNLKDATILPK